MDQRDGKPFSTEFSFTRFLVPTLAKEAQVGRYVAFVDGDFLFQEDPRNILDVVKAYRAPVYVVKHDYLPTERYKMDGMLQSAYGCKLWSSLMLFDLENPLLRNLTPDRVNQMPGFALHQFKWLPSIDDVEALDPRWNVLTHKPWTGPVGAYHYTLGTPELKEDCPRAAEWLAMEKS